MFVASWPAAVAVANMQLFTNVMPKHAKGMAGHGFRFHFDVSVSFHFIPFLNQACVACSIKSL